MVSTHMRVHCDKCGTVILHDLDEQVYVHTTDAHTRYLIFKEVCRTLESKFTSDCEEARLLNICDQIHSS
jgi:hypothetical protein